MKFLLVIFGAVLFLAACTMPSGSGATAVGAIGFIVIICGLIIPKGKKAASGQTKDVDGGRSIRQIGYEERALEFYNECVKRKIVRNGVVNQEAKKLMAANYNIEESEVDRFFELGKTVKQQREEEAARVKMEKDKAYETMLIEGEKETSSVYGKEKYLVKLRSEIQKQAGDVESVLGSMESAQRNQFYIPQHKDPTLSAAWYSAVAGTAAGVSEANKVVEENRRQDKMAANIRQASMDYLSTAGDQLGIAQGKQKILEERMRSIMGRLIDDSDPDEKLSLISFLDSSFEKSNGQNIKAKIKIRVKRAKLLNSDAILDGSLRFDLKNESGKIVASGIYNAPGYGEYFLNNVGFSPLRKIEVLCSPTENWSSNDELNSLTVSVTPIHLWLIEGKQYPKKTMENAVKEYLKYSSGSSAPEIRRNVPALQEMHPRLIDQFVYEIDGVVRDYVDKGPLRRYYVYHLRK